jgi:hypothetical protein
MPKSASVGGKTQQKKNKKEQSTPVFQSSTWRRRGALVMNEICRF